MPILKQHSNIQFTTALMMYKRNYDHFSILLKNWYQNKNLVLPCGPGLKYVGL